MVKITDILAVTNVKQGMRGLEGQVPKMVRKPRHASIIGAMDTRWKPNVTVAAIIEKEGLPLEEWRAF
jgi:hypothetical protein